MHKNRFYKKNSYSTVNCPILTIAWKEKLALSTTDHMVQNKATFLSFKNNL